MSESLDDFEDLSDQDKAITAQKILLTEIFEGTEKFRRSADMLMFKELSVITGLCFNGLEQPIECTELVLL